MEGKVKIVLRLSGFETLQIIFETLQNIFESGGTTFEVEKNIIEVVRTIFEVDFWTPFRVYFCLGC